MTGQDNSAQVAEMKKKELRARVLDESVKIFDEVYPGFKNAVEDMKTVVGGAHGEEAAFDTLTRTVLPIAAIYSKCLPATTDADAPTKTDQVIASVFISMPEQVLLDMGFFLASKHSDKAAQVVMDYLKSSVPGAVHTCETMRYDAALTVTECYQIRTDLKSGKLDDLDRMHLAQATLALAAEIPMKLQAPKLQMMHMMALEETLCDIERAIEFKQNDLAIVAAAKAAGSKTRPSAP